ncbi:MAG: pantoate--beta-alanine ligase, partial [Micavibrio aeruginosavorus]
ELKIRGFTKVDYCDIRDAKTLQSADTGSKIEKRILAAAWIGTTRLIDNITA